MVTSVFLDVSIYTWLKKYLWYVIFTQWLQKSYENICMVLVQLIMTLQKHIRRGWMSSMSIPSNAFFGLKDTLIMAQTFFHYQSFMPIIHIFNSHACNQSKKNSCFTFKLQYLGCYLVELSMVMLLPTISHDIICFVFPKLLHEFFRWGGLIVARLQQLT